MSKVAAVVPTCRGYKVPEQSIPVDWYVVHDREEWPVAGKRVDIIAPDPELYGSRCDSIRSAGFLRAIQDGAEYVLTVDDDCVLRPDWAAQHVNALRRLCHPWSETTSIRTRGLPYDAVSERVAISHGMWDGVPDLDAETQIRSPMREYRNDGLWRQIRPPFAQSAMNFGFRREVAVAMYQPAQGEGCVFDRFADIWGGLLAQRTLMLHSYAFMNGGAVVYHDRMSDPEVNLRKEAPGRDCNESFWKHVWSFSDKKTKVVGTYMALANHIEDFHSGRDEWDSYFDRIARNMRTWASLMPESVL